MEISAFLISMKVVDYLDLKQAHVGLVAISYVLFNLRALLAICGVYHPSRSFRFTVHAVDTLLLVCGIGLAWMLSLNPIEITWLGAKITGLFLYIALGSFALKNSKSLRLRITTFVLSQIVFGYIVMVAVNKSAVPFVS